MPDRITLIKKLSYLVSWFLIGSSVLLLAHAVTIDTSLSTRTQYIPKIVVVNFDGSTGSILDWDMIETSTVSSEFITMPTNAYSAISFDQAGTNSSDIRYLQSDEVKWRLRFFTDDDWGTLNFQNGSGADASTSRLYINGEGNIGMGTTQPDAKLHVNGPQILWSSDNTLAGSQYGMVIGANNTIWAWDIDEYFVLWETNEMVSDWEPGVWDASMIIGNENTLSGGNGSLAAGNYNYLEGLESYVFGRTNTGDGRLLFVFGFKNIVDESYSVAFGRENVVNGKYAWAMGYSNTVPTYSTGGFALGYDLETSNAMWSSAIWRYNVAASDALFTVGNGASDASRSNALTILDGGNVGIATDTPAQALDVHGNIAVDGATVHTSDERYKKEITPLTNVLEKISNIRGVTYKRDTTGFPDKQWDEDIHIGVLAQEVQEVFPELVLADQNGYLAVDYSRLTPILLEAIKEQQNQLDEQAAAIASLESKINSLSE